MRADVVKAQISQMLTNYPELSDDDEALIASLESETDAISLCELLTRAAKETDAHVDALARYISDMKVRKDRLELRSEKLRETLLKIMEAAGVNTLRLPAATLSARPIQHLVIVNQDEIPEEFRRYPPWEPMKQLIKAAIKERGHVPGCTMSNPEPSLSIRVK